MKKNHPYEEVAYFLTPIENSFQQVGSGVIGTLPKKISIQDFAIQVKKAFKIDIFKHTNFCKNEVQTIALCGGAGSFLLKTAISQFADVFISSDFKYHEYFDAENKTIIFDIGHYESEQFTTELFYDIISKKMSNIAIRFSETITNPVTYHR